MTATAASLNRPRATGRLEGIDALRALAMVGMVVAHYVERSEPGTIGDRARAFVDGRAMPTFVLLAGVGISLLTRRARRPDRELLVRALLLFPAGLALQEATTVVAVILQYYAVYFVLAVPARRLPDAGLVIAAVVSVLAGGVAVMVVGPRLPADPGWDGLGTVTDAGLWSALLVNGYYPVLPTIGLVLAGMWIGRRPIGAGPWPRRLVAGGLALATIGYGGGWLGRQVFDRPADDAVVVDGAGRVALVGPHAEAIAAHHGVGVGDLEADANGRPTPREAEATLRARARAWEREEAEFVPARLLSTDGHSHMPAWVVGAGGLSIAALGGMVAAARRWPRPLRALVVLGQCALSFYVVQAVVIRWLPERAEVGTAREYLDVAVVVVACWAFFLLWRKLFDRGPLEAVLRAAGRAVGGR